MRFLLTALFAGLLAVSASAQTVLYPGMQGDELLAAIRADYTPSQTLSYSAARDALYAYTVSADGELCGVYTGFCVQVPAGTTPRAYMNTVGMNTEHTWPQSLGANDARQGEMHNLFPTRVAPNSARGNDPFGEIVDTQTQTWYRDASQQSAIPTTDIDEWSEDTGSRFEPREDHKGNAARAVFYFYAIYDSAITSTGDAFFAGMRDDLIEWNEAIDPVDDRERARSAFIATRQGTENPFILDPTLARRAFSPTTVATEDGPDALALSVFPNPTAGRITVQVPGMADVRIDVTDALGRRVRTDDRRADGSGRLALDLGDLPTGLYAVRVTTEAGTATRRVVVVR